MSLSEISWLNAALSQGDVALPSKMRFPAWTIRTIVVHPFAGPAIHRTKTRSFPSDSNGPSVQRGMTKFARHTQHQAFIRGWRCTGGRSHGPTHGAPQAGDQLPPPAPRGRGWSGGFGRVSGQSGVPRGGGSKVRLDFGGRRSDPGAKLLLRRWYREGIGVRADLGECTGFALARTYDVTV